MQLEKTHHESNKGIYAKSIEVDPADEQVKQTAKEMVEWLDENNGSFDGEHESALAVAHCQVAPIEEPYKLFVVADHLLIPEDGADEDEDVSLEDYYWEARAIFNAEILETPEKIKREVPKRSVEDKGDGSGEVKMEMEEKEMTNIIELP